MEYSKGIDVSYHQDKAETKDIHIDFQKAKNSPIDFAILRSSIGLKVDRDYKLNITNARKTDLIIGAYHFLTWAVSGKEQARFFYDLVKDDNLDFLCCDFEPNYMVKTPNTAINLLYDFLVELKKLYSGKIIIYTGAFFWNEYGSDDSFYTQFPLWVASYSNQEYMEKNVKELTPWKQGWTFWQYSASGIGKNYGVESAEIDLDYFNGTLEDLRIFLGSNEQPETETDELLNQFETQLEQVKADVDALIVYSYKLVSLVREMKQLEK